MLGNSPLYAAVDLGSNSFHMLIVRNIEGAIRSISKVKRKVRLAAGLDDNNVLSEEAMQRAFDCLRLFAEQLENVPSENIRIVGTATLRLAKNSDEFLLRAEKILNQPIEIISGECEGRLIYYGVLSTTYGEGNSLVVDIGGASTEIVIGIAQDIKILHSTQMGCVTWRKRFFSDDLITIEHYKNAINTAKEILKPYAFEYLKEGFINCFGASGTIQALKEINNAQGKSEIVTYKELLELKDLTIKCGSFAKLSIKGLPQEQLTVFPSGLSILIAIFESLKVSSMSLAGGALREGLIYSLLKNSFNIKDIRNQTIESIISRYQIDKEQAKRVLFIANKVFDSVKNEWGIDDLISNIILSAASLLNELGLCIEYKKASQHAAYIINNIEMPGYTISQKILISALLYNQKDVMNLELLKEQNTVSYEHAIKLARLLRIAIIFAHSRNDDIYKDDLHFIPQGNCGLLISLPFRWLDTHYLRATELKEEILYQKQNDWHIELQEQYA